MPTRTPLSRFERQSPKQRLEFTIDNFDGLDNNNDPSSVKDTYSPDVLNCIYDSVGSIQNRKGYIKLLTTSLSGAIAGMRACYKSDQTTKQLVYQSGQYWYRYDNAGGSVQLPNTGGSYTAFTNNRQWDMDQYFDRIFGVNGADGLYQYDFSQVSQVTGFTGATPQYIKTHKNRLWLAGDPTYPSRIYFSDAGSITSFPVNNFIDVNTNDGQVITGLAIALDSLIVFKSNSIWVIEGEPLGSGNTTTIGNLNLRRANSDVGCSAFRTIQNVGSSILFMHSSGIYVFENYQTRRISDDINTIFKSGMNGNFINLSWAIYYPGEKKYILGYPSATSATPDKVIVYDTIVNKFVVWDDMPGSVAVLFKFNQAETMLVGDPVKGIIYQHFNGYADIAGDYGTATSGTTTTLTDTTKSWTTNQFKDAKLTITSGLGASQSVTVASNTATTLTFSSALTTAPNNTSSYTIGGYVSYWTSKIFDFNLPQFTKKYKYLNLFADSEASYNLQLGVSIGDAIPVNGFTGTPVALGTSSSGFDTTGIGFDSSLAFDGQTQLFKRANLGQQGRFIQIRFGNYNANQPWRVFSYAISYKLKKARAS